MTSAPPICSAAARVPRTATRGRTSAATSSSAAERPNRRRAPEPFGEGGVEGRQVLVPRAECRAQREVGGRAIPRVDGRERAVGGQHLTDAEAHAAGPQGGGEQREAPGHARAGSTHLQSSVRVALSSGRGSYATIVRCP